VGKKPERFIDGATWKRARLRFKLSQVRAAEIVGVDETTVQKWEGGQTKKVRRIYLEKLREGATRSG
jgi:DNA-binding transcriptional regulator YiaG